MTKYTLQPGHNHDEVYAKIGEGGGGVTDHGLLDGLEDNDHPQYLLTTGKAADSDKLDNIDSTGFVQTSGNQSVDGVKTFTSFPILPATGTIMPGNAIPRYYADQNLSPIGHEHNTFSTSKFVQLTDQLASTNWDGDSYSTVSTKTKIDLSAEFGVPEGIKAVLMWVAVRDSGSANTDTFIRLSPYGSSNNGLAMSCPSINDRYARGDLIVPCDANGDIYYQITASGTGTFDVYLQIWGYWIDEVGLPVSTYEDCQVSAYRDATTFTLTTSGSIYAIPLNQESYDTHGAHDNNTNPSRFTCQKAGTYLITGQVSFAANATGNRDALLRVNGTDYVGQMRLQAASSGSTSVPATAIVQLNVGDYVELCGRQYSGGSLGLYYANSISNYLTMAMITKTNADAWQDWTPTQIGWTALPTGVYRYKIVGKTCFFYIDITAGTSNGTSAILTLPVPVRSGAYYGGVNGMCMNNGTVLSVATKWYIDTTMNRIQFGTDMGVGLFTASGTKRMRCEGFYEIA